MLNSIGFSKKKFSIVLRSPTGVQCSMKNERRFSTAKSTSFYSEFNADFEYVGLFGKYRGQKKMALSILVL
jgi:hypothetical protein